MTQHQDADRQIPVTILTGFLGAGKTTLLNHLLRQPEMADAAVLINESCSTPAVSAVPCVTT